ncbi:MAG: type IV secretion system protein [Burkholderiaceae bacterium]
MTVQSLLARRHYAWLALLGLLLLVVGAPVFAQVPGDNSVDGIVLPFVNLFTNAGVRNNVIGGIETIFWSLALIELVVSAGLMAVSPNGGDISGFITLLIQRILLIGIFHFFLTNGWDLANFILRSAFWFGGAAIGANPLSGAEVADRGINIITTWFSGVSILRWNIISGLGLVLIMFSLLWLYILIAGQVIVALCEAYIMAFAGIFLLGFGGASWTRDIAVTYFRGILGSAFKLVVMQVIVGAGLTIVDGWIGAMNARTLSFAQGVTMLVAVGMIWRLSTSIPDMAGNMLRGFGGPQPSAAGGIANAVGRGADNVAHAGVTAAANASTARIAAMGPKGMAAAAAITAVRSVVGGASRGQSVPGPGSRRK